MSSRAPLPVTLRQLQYIVAVADLKNFHKAASACRVAQPSLSSQLAQAEEALAVQLFERGRGGVTVTAAGAPVIERARAILVAADELVEAARLLSDPFGGSLRIGIIPTVAPYLLPEIAPLLRRRFPKLELVWREDKTPTLRLALERGELDGALLALEGDLAAGPHVELGVDPFVLAVATTHRLAAGKGPIKPEAFADESVLVLDDGHCFRDQVLSFCAQRGVTAGGYRATSLPTLVQMAAGGAGVTLLPSLAIAVENRRDSLRIRRIAPHAPSRTIALAWRRGSARAAALKAVGEVLHEAYVALLRRTQR